MVRSPIYNYDYRTARTLSNPHFSLKNLELLLQDFEEERYKDRGYAAAFLNLLPRNIARRGLTTFFENLLQSFKAGPKEQKLLEKGAQEFHKAKIRRSRDPVTSLLEKKEFYQQLYKAAQSTIERGEPLSSSELIKAGGFVLINTGGFDEKVMGSVKEVVEKASKLLHSKGLGKVCYGEVNITGTVLKSRTLAHYNVPTDEFYVRANLKGKKGPAVQTVIHELAHRLQYKFLGGNTRPIKDLYRLIDNESQQKLETIEGNKDKWPKEGDIIDIRGNKQKVTEVKLNRRYKYEIHTEDVNDRKWIIPLESYLKITYETTSFITSYAATDPEENFCEMIAAYCLGELPDDQKRMLEDIL